MSKSLVLNFHNVQDGVLFEKIILALKSRYQIVSLQQLNEMLVQGKAPKNICHISFDDGESSFYHVIFPVLKKHKVPVSLFVSADIIVNRKNFWFQEVKDYNDEVMKKLVIKKFQLPATAIEKFSFREIFKSLTINNIEALIADYQAQTKCNPTEPMNMTLSELLEVDASGLVTVGAHTLRHPILKNEDDQSSFTEITASIKMLQQILGHPVKYFAYPNGRPGIDFGNREQQYLRDNNIDLAFSTELDHLSPFVDLLRVPRMGFPRMGLYPAHPLIYFRLFLGKRWIDIKSITKPSEKKLRKQIALVFNHKP